ncbi:MAG: bifunctional demethylmenaquinone methyltransferase/2-methoxy-6-polyprenyl-1,4-benzoquinol methylase UbiE [Deferribacteraceae bacterium]|jgi:demethylmenaquinone methyltransferase/2-methoxy-6-polyprenyl-1,4-benzoquinol methylase|nr:bifunctional demethylmenaquinone methyltransferase/2-methoxy-6-polyprenyl-1,4-benzoquinol methylase UbiE [Deferribacteraceae bacterium]
MMGVHPPDPLAIRGMFDEISPRYDLINHLLSFGRDISWRRRAVQALGVQDGYRVLDLACGTGDMLKAIKAAAPNCTAFGGDFSINMLRAAAKKGTPAYLAALDACALPFVQESFDLITFSFGFRNIPDKARALQETFRVLKPGGALGVLEFSKPKGKLFSAVYWFYFRYIFPVIGALISANMGAYAYLPSSVAAFPDDKEYTAMVEAAGFSVESFTAYDLGVCSLLAAKKR